MSFARISILFADAKESLSPAAATAASGLAAAEPEAAAAAVHYGTKPGHFETSIFQFPTSEGVSEVSERANE